MAPFLRPRLALLSDLRARTPTLLDFVPDEDVVSFETPDAVDLTGVGTLVLDLRSRVVPLLAALQVIEVVDWSSSGVVRETQEWRVLTRRTLGGDGVGTVTLTLVTPLVYDWACPGRLRTQPSGGIATYDLSGDYTPADALDIALDALAANGQSYWTAGTIDRTDVKHLTIQNQNSLELLHAILDAWAVEAEPIRASATSWTIGLRNKRGASAAVTRVNATGALQSVDWTEDATPLANAVQAAGANDASIAHAAWPVTAIASGVLSLVDEAGDVGPIQVDGQLVGAYVERLDGTRTQITATAVNDRTTSHVTVASTTGISTGDVLELRADSSGTRLVVLQDDDAITGGAFRREVPLERSDLDDVRNYIPNARGAVHGGSPDLPTGWVLGHNAPGTTDPTMTRITTPAGCPIGDDGTGSVWELTGTSSTSGPTPGPHYVRLPVTPTFDAASGDATFVASLWVAATAAFSGLTVRLVHSSTTPISGTALASTTVTSVSSSWTRIDLLAVTLGSADDLVLEITPSTGLSFQGAIAAGQIARGTAYRVFAEHPHANLLWQATNAHLVVHRVPTDAIDAVVVDLALVDAARWGDLPLVTGGDVQLVDDRIGLDRRVRILSVIRNRWAPAPPKLVVTAAPDAAIAALVGKAAPSRVQDLLDILQQVAAQGSAA